MGRDVGCLLVGELDVLHACGLLRVLALVTLFSVQQEVWILLCGLAARVLVGLGVYRIRDM